MSSKGTTDQCHRPGKGVEPVQIVGMSKLEDACTSHLLGDIFSTVGLGSEASADGVQKAVTLSNLDCNLDLLMQEELRIHADAAELEENRPGRLGPKECAFCFDIKTNVGTLIVDADRLGV